MTEVAEPRTILTLGARRLESLDDGTRFVYLVGGRRHDPIDNGNMAGIDRTLGDIAELPGVIRISLASIHYRTG
jgi:hypothetical protein